MTCSVGWITENVRILRLEDVVVGTCEMAEGGGCLYVKGSWKLDENVRGWGDKGGWWAGDELGTGEGMRNRKTTTNKLLQWPPFKKVIHLTDTKQIALRHEPPNSPTPHNSNRTNNHHIQHPTC